MHQLENYTPFESQLVPGMDRHGGDALVLGVKATYELTPEVKLAEEQIPFVMADEYYGEPGQSSLKYCAELFPTKPGSDVVLMGHAQVPEGQQTDVLDAYVSVGNASKTVRVFGDRLWVNGGMSAPKPFQKIPLTFENAYGGIHHFKNDQPLGPKTCVAIESNPVGKGFLGKRLNRDMIGEPLPNIEDPRYLIRVPSDQPEPAGFGYVAPNWNTRSRFAGTFDEAWSKTRSPILPVDFDERFFLSGSKGLSFERRSLQGGEPVRLVNVAPQSDIQFQLPDNELKSYFKLKGSWFEAPLSLETMIIEPDENRFCLIWKAQFPCDKQMRRVSHVRVDLPSNSQARVG